jgi:hypothetical protein
MTINPDQKQTGMSKWLGDDTLAQRHARHAAERKAVEDAKLQEKRDKVARVALIAGSVLLAGAATLALVRGLTNEDPDSLKTPVGTTYVGTENGGNPPAGESGSNDDPSLIDLLQGDHPK